MDTKKTIVEEGTEFRGSMNSSCPIEVRGRIEGELSTPALAVSPSGAVHGKAKIGTLKSDGEISGSFDADTVQLAGKVMDNTVIRANTIDVKLNAGDGKMQVTFGDVELEVGDAPGKDGNKKKGKKGDNGGDGDPSAEG